jgi:hypothetical protein
MISIYLALMFGTLAVILLDGNWRGGLVVTFVIGFLQDPLRKITPGSPSTMAGLVLVAFVLCLLVMHDKSGGRLNLRAMFWTVPAVQEWLPLYNVLIAGQAVNSYFRFGDITLTGLGIAFYAAPAIALWAGYLVGCNPRMLRRLVVTYVTLCTIFAITVFLDFRGVQNELFEEVGGGILITFEGFSAQGASGFWRTSEIASWHLAAAACFAMTLALSSQRRYNQILFLILAAFFGYLTIPTGRRKGLVLVLSFVALYLLLFSSKATPASREKLFTSVLGSAAMAYAGYAMFLISAKGDSFDLYLNRSVSAKDDLFGRFNVQGIIALTRGLEVSQGFGLGVGAGANLGNLKVSAASEAQRSSIQSLGFVSEGGGGRIVSELGLPGLVVGGALAYLIGLCIWRNFNMLNRLAPGIAYLLLGMIAFGLANILFFFSAAQVYSDPFILILMGLSFGSFLAVPTLVARQQAQQLQAGQLQSMGMAMR